MAHKKSGGSSSNGRDSAGRRTSSRQGGGKDHTLFALIEGAVNFVTKRNNRTYVNVAAPAQAAE